MFLLLQSKLC